MKFYYNGKLIRTSQNHNYTHAVIDTERNNALIGCRASKDTAESVISGEINRLERSLKNHEAIKKALENGKPGFYGKDGRRTYWVRFSENESYYTLESVERWMICDKKEIEYVKNNWKVVELEAREA